MRRIFQPVVLLLLAVNLGGCAWPFHGPTVSPQEGTWSARIESVPVIDEQNEVHTALVARIDETGDAHDHPGSTGSYFSHPLRPLLVDHHQQLILDGTVYPGEKVIVTGTLEYGDQAHLAGNSRRVVRASQAAIVRHDDGREERLYSNTGDLILVVKHIKPVQ